MINVPIILKCAEQRLKKLTFVYILLFAVTDRQEINHFVTLEVDVFGLHSLHWTFYTTRMMEVCIS